MTQKDRELLATFSARQAELTNAVNQLAYNTSQTVKLLEKLVESQNRLVESANSTTSSVNEIEAELEEIREWKRREVLFHG